MCEPAPGFNPQVSCAGEGGLCTLTAGCFTSRRDPCLTRRRREERVRSSQQGECGVHYTWSLTSSSCAQ